MADKEEITGAQPKRKRRTMRMADHNEQFHRKPLVTAEEELRNENPGLQELWEQYQTMLKLLTPAKKVLAQTTRPKKRISIEDFRSAFTKGNNK